MPRFSDVFTYVSMKDGPGRYVTYFDCHFMKSFSDITARERAHSVTLDIDGVCIFITRDEKIGKDGPYSLSIPASRKD